MKQLLELTQEKFQKIYTDEKLRNAVAYSHQCCDKGGRFLHYKALCYPIDYIVTEVQRKEANQERERAKKAKIKSIGNKLVFVGMGCNYDARYNDDVCNHRIRTEFRNKEGKRFFIEVGTGRNVGEMRVDFSIDRDLEIAYDTKRAELHEKRSKAQNGSKEYYEITDEIHKYLEQPFYNYAGLQRRQDLPKYTLQSVLMLVNEVFNCAFTEIEVDYYNLSTDDFICKSPK